MDSGDKTWILFRDLLPSFLASLDKLIMRHIRHSYMENHAVVFYSINATVGVSVNHAATLLG